MRSTQDKVMAALEAAADTYELDLVVDRSYSNTGFVRFETRDLNSTPVLAFRFDFQTTYWMFDHIKPVIPGLRDPDEKGRQFASVWPPDYHNNSDKPEDVIAAIRNHLARWKAEMRRQEEF